MKYGGQHSAELGRDHRVGNEMFFERYFHFGVPPDDVSDKLIRDVLTEITTGEIGAAVKAPRQAAPSRGERIISKLSAHEE